MSRHVPEPIASQGIQRYVHPGISRRILINPTRICGTVIGENQTDPKVKALLKTPGVHRVGAGLYLRVSESGAVYWMYRYMKSDQAHEIALSPTYASRLPPTARTCRFRSTSSCRPQRPAALGAARPSLCARPGINGKPMAAPSGNRWMPRWKRSMACLLAKLVMNMHNYIILYIRRLQ